MLDLTDSPLGQNWIPFRGPDGLVAGVARRKHGCGEPHYHVDELTLFVS